MLRKRARSNPKNQPMMPNSVSESYFQSDIPSQMNHKSTSFLKVPGLFVGFNPRSSEFDSVQSPTSTLDFRIFSSFGNPFRLRKVSASEGHSNRWDYAKVGLSIVDSLEDEKKNSGKIVTSFDSKNAVFEQEMSVRNPNVRTRNDFMVTPKSLPANLPAFCNIKQVGTARKGDSDSDVVFEIGEGVKGPKDFRACSLDSGRFGSHLTNFGSRLSTGSGNLSRGDLDSISPLSLAETNFIGSIPTSEIEQSEEYTCVRTHGPNPKVTHIFGDRVFLECREDEALTKNGEQNVTPEAGGLDSFSPDDFLKFCYSCRKKLDGEDIYMYRGEKAFCSYGCRLQEIEIEEEMEKATKNDMIEISDKSGSGLFIAT